MFTRTDNFKRYISQAQTDHPSFSRAIIGIAFSVLMFALFTFIIFAFGYALYLLFNNAPDAGKNLSIDAESIDKFLSSTFGQMILILTVASFWLGPWISLRIIHKRPIETVLGQYRAIDWDDFKKAFIAFSVPTFTFQLIALTIDPNITYNQTSLLQWIPLALAVALLLLIQTSAEEFFFRGYLMQLLAHRFSSPLIWALIPVLLFTALHYKPEIPFTIGAIILIVICVLAILFTYFVTKTGNLGAAMGAHFANNPVAVLMISTDTIFSSLSLFKGIDIHSLNDLTASKAVIELLAPLALIAIAAMLNMHSKSPLALKAFKQEAQMPLASVQTALDDSNDR